MTVKLKKSKKMLNEYKSYIFKAVPFRTPILKKGHGSYLEDIDGNKYLDMMSGQFCTVLGYNHNEFNKIIIKQLKELIHTNTLYLSKPVLLAAKALGSITAKNLKKVIILSTGAEAVEFAIRNAKFYTKKEGIVGVGNGYHGLTLATQSISTNGLYAKPRVQKSYSIPTPDYFNRLPGQTIENFISMCLKKSRKQLEKKMGEIAAFVVEPIISVGGMIFPQKEYFKGLEKIAKEHNALMIFDECQTGLARTGEWFAYERIGVIPDMLILAKAAGLGLPVSAVVIKNKIAKSIENQLTHFSSHQNDPIAGIILEFLIKYIKRNNLLKKIKKTGDYFLKQLEILSEKEPWLENPRGLGLMLGFNLPHKEFSKNRNPGQELISLLEKKNILIQATQKGKTFRILPNYLISKKEIDIFITALRNCLEKISSSKKTIR